MLKVRACRYGTMMFRVNDIYIGGSLAAYAEFSEGECELFRAWLRPGDTAIDVGANIGCHTVAMSRFVGEAGRVVAFEPQRVPYQMLCGNVALNDLRNVWAYWAPCSWNHRPVCVPDLPAGEHLNFGGMSLLEDHTSPVYEVEPIRIDDLGLDDVRLVKVDVEGMELDVLRGGEVTIMRDLPILYV